MLNSGTVEPCLEPPKNQVEMVFMDVWSLFRHSVTWKSSMKYWQIILMHLSCFMDTTVVLMMCFFMFSSESVWSYLVYSVFDCLTYVNFFYLTYVNFVCLTFVNFVCLTFVNFVWPMSALFVCLFQDNRRTSTEMFGTATRVYSLQPFTVATAID